MPDSHVLHDGLVCFRAVNTANCHHKGVVTGGKQTNDLPQFRWINSRLGNVMTSIGGTFYAFNFDQDIRRYLGGYCLRFNRPFSMARMTDGIADAVGCWIPCMEMDLRVSDLVCN